MKKLLCAILAGMLLLCAVGPVWSSAAEPDRFVDPATGIIVYNPDGAFPAGTTMQVSVKAADLFGAINRANAVYEITFVCGGAVVHPAFPVTMLVPVRDFDPALEVFYVAFDFNDKGGHTVDMNSRLKQIDGVTYWECSDTNLGGYYAVAPEGYRIQKALKYIFTTRYESKFWNWVLFIVCFGWIWMWFI